MIVKGFRKDKNGVEQLVDIVDLNECTYTGKDMGERVINATVKYPVPLHFRKGDYIDVDMATLMMIDGKNPAGSHEFERFYIYSMPSVKKIASSMSSGDAFEHTIKLYPRQYELAHIMMRDVLQENTVNNIMYTGFGDFSFYGGAEALATRIQYVLDAFLEDTEPNSQEPWVVRVADSVNERLNSSLEKYEFTFSENSVMDALVMLTKEGNVNTTFYIRGREIYIGYKRPTVCCVDNDAVITDTPYVFMYGKTSHQKISHGSGGLFNITKTVDSKIPVNKLYVYGGNRNLNRFYCADRLKVGRYVNKLMLPSFNEDGKTDYIKSNSSIAKYGIHEGVRTFEDIYPSLRYLTYGDLRTIKYVIKIMGSGIEDDPDETRVNSSLANDGQHKPIVRIQCYKIVKKGKVNVLERSYPDKPIAVYIHALSTESKRVMCVLYNSQTEQERHDGIGNIPVDKKNNPIKGACFAVHDDGFPCLHNHNLSRADWFENINSDQLTEDEKREIELFQINYGDTFWVSDVYEFTGHNQTFFNRKGYSAYCYPRVNQDYYGNPNDLTRVDEVVAVGRVKDVDTWWTLGTSLEQPTFEIYLRDVGFKINEQTPFGDNVFVFNGTFLINFQDGALGGLDFEVSAKNGSEIDENVVPAFKSDGSRNDEFITGANDPDIAREALNNGAYWRITCKRNESKLEETGYILPSHTVNAHSGDKVVFLNIYMPNVYVMAAERRLYREALRYLNNNDSNAVNYSVESDKVRLQQIPELALQLREGVTMRVEDEDLQIATENNEHDIFEGSNENFYEERVYKNSEEYWYEPMSENTETMSKGIYIFYATNIRGWDKYRLATVYLPYDEGDIKEIRASFDSKYEAARKPGEAVVYKPYSGYFKFSVVSRSVVKDTKGYFSLDPNTDILKLDVTLDDFNQFVLTEKDGVLKNEIQYLGWDNSIRVGNYGRPFEFKTECAIKTTVFASYEHSVSESAGTIFNAIDKKTLAMYTRDRYYTLEVELPVSVDNVLPFTGYTLCLFSGFGDGAKVYHPEYTYEDSSNAASGFVHRTYHFYINDAFNDTVDYYAGFEVACDGFKEYVKYKIFKITESNTGIDGTVINHVDLVVDQITIKLTNSANNVWKKPEDKNYVYREIQLTIKEQQRASAWASLMEEVQKGTMLGEQSIESSKTAISTARQESNKMNALKGSIFDPDGRCTDTFVQTMMMQVGADSMNYMLENTRVFNGVANNIALVRPTAGDTDPSELTIGADVLHHYVYVENIAKGNWVVNAISTPVLINPDVTYYIAVKCPKDNSTASWYVSTEQMQADPDDGFYYFNYGIITKQNGDITIIETRGNAYMYGDNIVCGKITTIDGGSYFDLTRGVFKLGEGLEYKNGELNVGGTFKTDNNGMVVTNVLKLKDRGVVKSGMSGVESDGVLLWGGGTYEDAQSAAGNDDFSTQDGKLLTTLLKPDGTGKIGIFQISEDKIRVVNDKKVCIEITSNELKNVIPQSTAYNFTYPSSGYHTITCQNKTYSQIPNTVYKRNTNGTLCVSKSRITVRNCYISNNKGDMIDGTVSIKLVVLDQKQRTVGEIDKLNIAVSSSALKSDEKSKYGNRVFEAPSSVNVYMALLVESDKPDDYLINMECQVKVEAGFADTYEPKTIIATNGLASIADGNHYFIVHNSNTKQTVAMKGLSFDTDGLSFDTGQIYRDRDGFIKIADYHF